MVSCNCPVDRHGLMLHKPGCHYTKWLIKDRNIKFCWICSKRFFGNKKYAIHDEKRSQVFLVHKQCAVEHGYEYWAGY